MSFSEWSNTKKKREQEEQEKQRIANTKAVNGGRETFGEWSGKKISSQVDPKYINDFLAEADSFFKSAEKESGTLGWGNTASAYESNSRKWSELDTKAATISVWLQHNKSNLDSETYKNLAESIETIKRGGSSYISGLQNNRDFYAQFETEEAYKKYESAQKEKEAVLNSKDFKDKSGYVSTESDNWWNKAWSQYSLGYDDLTYEYINNQNGLRDEIKQKYRTYSRDNMFAEAESDYEQKGYDHLKADEIAIYNYYYNTEGKERAQKYLDSIEDELVSRKAGEEFKALETETLKEIFYGIVTGADQFRQGFENLGDFIVGGDGFISSTQYVAGAVREDLADDGFKVFGQSVGQMGYDILNTTSNMLPSILVGAATGGLGGAVTLGLSSTGNAYAEMKKLGYSDGQARGYAALTGASETLLQYALGGISKLGGKVSGNAVSKLISKIDNAFARTAIKVGGSMASEGLEEAIQTVLEPAFKALVTGEQFEGAEWDEILYSGLLGALSAGFLEGAPTIAGTAATNINAKKVYGDGSTLVNEALSVAPEGSELSALANKYKGKLDGGKSLSGQQIVLLDEAIRSNDTTTIKKAALRRLGELGETTDVTPVAEVLTKYALGEKLSSKDNAVLNNSDFGHQVLAELNKNNIKSGGLGNNWAENIGTRRVSPEVYNKELYDLAKQQAGINEAIEKGAVAKTVAETEKSIEGKVKVSENGKTVYTDEKGNSEDVTINKIVSTEGGIKVELEGGKTVKASDLSFSSEEEALMYEMVARMEVAPDTANEIISTFKPANAQQGLQYLTYVPLAYQYGKIGYEAGLKNISLSEEQKRIAYNRGRMDAVTEAKASTKSKVTNTQKKTEASAGKSGIIYESGFTYDESKATDIQKASMAGIEVINKMSSLEVHIFESRVENGKRVAYVNGKKVKAPNGYFTDGNKIYIDFNAGNGGEGAMLYTMSHEVAHYIRKWNAKGFKELGDFLISEYGKHGVPVYALLEAQKDTIKKRYAEENKTLPSEAKLADMAYEELVADAMSTMFADPKAYEKLAKLKKKNHTLWQKLGEAIKALLDKIKSALGIYSKYTPDAIEADYVKKFAPEVYEKLQDLYLKAFVEADANYEAARNDGSVDLDGNDNAHLLSDRSMIEGAGLQFVIGENGTNYKVFDKNGKPVKSVTAETIVDSPLGNLVTMAKNEGFLGKGATATLAAKQQYQFLADLVNMCINYNGIAPIWETAGTMVFSSMKSNADKQYGLTIDFSTVCKKTQAIVDAMSEAMLRLGRGLNRAEVEAIYLEVGKAGESTPCPVCYVFSRWMGIGGILDQISRFQDKYTNMSEKSLQEFIEDIQQRIKDRAYTPNKEGKLKSAFFNKKGEISEGQVIADLKSKASSKAASALKAIANNSNVKLQIQELEALRETQEAKDAKSTTKKIEKLKKKLVEDSALEKEMRDANDTLEEYEAYQWLTRTLMTQVDGKWIKNSAFKPVPKDILFDLNKGDKFAEGYPLSWAFRTGKGASAGKAIVPYADARVGEAIQAVASQGVKDIKIGMELNPFLNSDTAGRLKILKSAIEKQARQNLVGGQRYQSTSDFRYEYGSDYLITFLEMQAIGAKVQLYTKVIEAVDFLASMGADCNLSVMPLSDGFITLPDGTKKLVYSSVTGINAEAAIKKAHEYNNVQLILVGISDEHIRLALEGLDVTFVIPFHGSGNSVHQIQALMNLLGENLDVTTAEDYTPVQSDHVSPKQTKEQKAMWNLRVKIIKGEASKITAAEQALLDKNSYLKDLYRRFYLDKKAEEYGVGLTSGQAEQIFPYEYWDKSLTYAEADKNGERFKEYCASMGIIPRFSGMNSKGESVGFGDFSNDKGYWKLLIDRPMYDNTYDADGNWTGYGKYHEQARINCSNFQVKHLDPEYGSATYGDVMSKANDPKKTNKIVDAALKQFENNELNDVRKTDVLGDALLSDRDSHGNELSVGQIEFYKDSKARDEDGNLLVLFHGTSTEQRIAEFKTTEGWRTGLWLTTDHETAVHFARATEYVERDPSDDTKLFTKENSATGDGRQGVYELYANVKNPLVVDAQGKRYWEIPRPSVMGEGDAVSGEEINAYAFENGYDGVIIKDVVEGSNRLGTDVIVFTGNQVKYTDNLNPTEGNDISYSDRDPYSYQTLISKPDMKLTTVGITAPNNRANIVAEAKKNAASVGKINPKDGSVSVRVEDIGSDVLLGTDGLIHGLRRGKGLENNANAIVTVRAGEILKNSIRINELIPSKVNATGSYVLIGAATDPNGDLYIVRSVVNQFNNELTAMDVLYAVNAKKKKLAALNAPRSTAKPLSVTNSTISIAQLLDFVNTYFPDVLPESVLRHYGYDARPEGELGESALYSDRTSYAPTFYSHMGKVIDDIKLDKMGASSILNHLKNRGVKDEEIKWSGIETFLEGKKSVTKAELQEFVAGSQLKIEEEMSDSTKLVLEDGTAFDSVENFKKAAYSLADEQGIDRSRVTFENYDDEAYVALVDDDIDFPLLEAEINDGGARWSQYKLDGGTNYRELVFKMPNSTYNNRAMRGHWGQDAEGILVHARIQDFEVDGKKMLFIEELQSDWHNEGHEKGYTTKEYEDAVAVYDKLAEDYANKRRAFNKYVRSGEFRSDPDDVSKKKFDWLRRKMEEAEKRMQDAERDINALKEKGMGDVPDAPFRNNYHEYVLKRLLRMAAEEGYDSIGWTPAWIQSDRWSEDYAEGYRIEYDQDIPKFLRKYGKKWGATVGKAEVTVAEHSVNGEHYDAENIEVWSMDITDSMTESVLYEGQVMYSDRVTNKKTLDFLENQEHITTYKSFVEIDGKLYSPMATKVKGDDGKYRLTNPSEIGVWQQAEEKPESIPKFHKSGYGYYVLKKDDGGSVTAAYNPYEHSSNLVLNDQFEAAYQRPNLVTVECVIPKSEMTSGYKAKYAKDSTGYLDWKSGTVAGKLKGNKRKVYLSRWLKPVRILSDAEVASMYKDILGSNISVPFNVVTPQLLAELEKVGVKIDYEGSPGYQYRQSKKTDGGDAKFSDRDPNSASNRSLLANALDSIAQSDIEKNKLTQYKKKIALIESEQAKLAEIRAEAQELRTKKGRTPDETKKMRDLDFEANQTANRINTYDKQLLNLESTSALKGVLEREKAMLRKRLEKKGKEALSAYKEKAAETQRELLTRYQESRTKAIEGRNKTEIRHKIKKVVSDLNGLLLNPTKDKHVPIGLQFVVAEALDAINMDTMNAEERVAYYNDLISKSTDPDEIAMLTKKRDFFEYRDANFKERITALKNAYAEFKESDDPLIRNAHNDAIEELIKNTADAVGNKSLKDMSLMQLEAVYNMYKAISATVRNANKMFKEGRQETVTENSEAVKTEVREVGGHKDRTLKMLKALKKFGWNMLKPITAMKAIGSKTFERLFGNVRAAEDTWAVDVSEAKQFYEDVSSKYGYKKWDFKKRYSFKDSAGNDFSLTLEQIMSLYAYSKREQADKHLEFGGFIFDDAIEVTERKGKFGIPLKYEVNDANPYRLRKEDLLAITDSLTTEQKGFIDEMQTYLSDVMGEKGNEVSLAMYDIKLYNEKNYFPLKTSRYFREFDPEKSGTPKVKNASFSKKTVPQAGNPIVLSNFMDVWAGHVNDMSMYHAFVLPLEDFMRVYNYSSTAGGYDSVQQYIKNAYGAEANQYIERLMDDLNGGARVDSTADPINKGLALFKKGSVFASASVVIQQPSAIARALAYINPKYFVTATPSAMNLVKHKSLWAEVKKYAPVAIIKEMGYFDTGIGRSSVEWIKGNQTVMDKVDDVLSKAPAIADELCWVHIWEAVKRETAAKGQFKVGSEEFLKECGRRFTEVITNTQVYDSVLSRSGMMRSKDTGMKMATAFLAEPTTTVNMMVDGIIQGKRGNKKFTASTVGAVSASVILNSILVALVYAARDDDEDETYAEKYIGSLTTELIDGFNPLTYIPFVKDVWSIAQGYDVERSDMTVVSKLWESVEGLFNEDKSGLDKVLDVAGTVSSLFGIPLKNIIRDAKGMYNLAETILSGTPTTKGGVGDALEGALTSSLPLWDRIVGTDSKSDNLYDAIMSGDKEYQKRLESGYKDGKAVETAKRKALRENDSRIKEAAQARLDGDIAEYTRIAKAIIAEGNFSQDTVVAAINAEITALKKDDGSASTPTDSNKVESIYKIGDYYSAIEGRDEATAYAVKNDIIRTAVANGKDKDEAEADFNSSFASHLRELYETGDITESKAKSMLINYGGKSEEDAQSKVQYWAFKKRYPDYDLSEEAVEKYYSDVEPSGIGISVYYDYSKRRAKCKGSDADGDGKTDSGSVKSEVLKVIDSLPITSKQKDTLYYLNGWSQSTIYQAPWR